MERKIAFTLGRWDPLHWGHLRYFLWLLSEFDRIIIGVGSCYEHGTKRHPLLAFIREKMIAYSLVSQGVDMFRVAFVHLQDFHDWDQWWQHIMAAPGVGRATHFVTGNEEEVVNVMKKKGIRTHMEFINPEKDMPPERVFPFRATHLREAISCGDYGFFERVAAPGTINLMGCVGGFAAIREAMKDRGKLIIPGRQTTDLIVTIDDSGNGKKVLCGFRKKGIRDFGGCLALPGGGIDDYENPMDAAVRELQEETGLEVKIVNRHLEPSHVLLAGIISELRFVGLFGTNDHALSGTRGGSSQVFHIHLEEAEHLLSCDFPARSDLEDVKFRDVGEVLRKGLAFQQTEMLRQAIGT